MNCILIRLSLAVALLGCLPARQIQAQSAQALVQEAAKAMGGMAALRAIKFQTIEVDGKQFDAVFPLQHKPGRQLSTFHYTLTRELTQPPV